VVFVFSTEFTYGCDGPFAYQTGKATGLVLPILFWNIVGFYLGDAADEPRTGNSPERDVATWCCFACIAPFSVSINIQDGAVLQQRLLFL